MNLRSEISKSLLEFQILEYYSVACTSNVFMKPNLFQRFGGKQIPRNLDRRRAVLPGQKEAGMPFFGCIQCIGPVFARGIFLF